MKLFSEECNYTGYKGSYSMVNKTEEYNYTGKGSYSMVNNTEECYYTGKGSYSMVNKTEAYLLLSMNQLLIIFI